MSATDLAFSHLRAALAISDLGSMGHAAKALHLSQPALSYQLRKLETALATTLFERTGRGMEPTPAGRRFLASARRIIDELETAERDTARIASGDQGILRLSNACYTTYFWLPALAEQFRAAYPDVDLEIDSNPRPTAIAAIEAGALDIALTTHKPVSDKIDAVPLFDDEIEALMRPDHPFAGREFLTADDFADQIVLVHELESSDLFNLVLRPSGVAPRHITEVRASEAMLQMARAGLGVTAMAAWAAAPDLEAGGLAAVRITEEGLHRNWWVVTAAGRSVPRAVRDLVRLLCRELPAQLGGLSG